MSVPKRSFAYDPSVYHIPPSTIGLVRKLRSCQFFLPSRYSNLKSLFQLVLLQREGEPDEQTQSSVAKFSFLSLPMIFNLI